MIPLKYLNNITAYSVPHAASSYRNLTDGDLKWTKASLHMA